MRGASFSSILFWNPISGKYYYEGTVTDDGLCRLGWSTSDALLDLGKFILIVVVSI